MKKSPLSTPSGEVGNFHRGRGRKRGYGYQQMRNDNDNFHRFTSSNTSPSNQLEGDMIPLDSSSPIYHNNRNNNRGNWRQISDRRNHRFSSTQITGSFNNQRSNQNHQGSPDSSYSPHKFQRNYQQQNHRQKNEPGWHRKLPISEFMDLKSIFENPWADLEKKLENSRNKKHNDTVTIDSSVEIILEKNRFNNSSSGSISEEGTINISSSCDDVKEGSSVDIPLDNIDFNQDSKNNSLLSDSNTSQEDKSLSENINQSQDESVVEIVS